MIAHLAARVIWVLFKWWCLVCLVLFVLALFKSYEDHYGPGAAVPIAAVPIATSIAAGHV